MLQNFQVAPIPEPSGATKASRKSTRLAKSTTPARLRIFRVMAWNRWRWFFEPNLKIWNGKNEQGQLQKKGWTNKLRCNKMKKTKAVQAKTIWNWRSCEILQTGSSLRYRLLCNILLASCSWIKLLFSAHVQPRNIHVYICSDSSSRILNYGLNHILCLMIHISCAYEFLQISPHPLCPRCWASMNRASPRFSRWADHFFDIKREVPRFGRTSAQQVPVPGKIYTSSRPATRNTMKRNVECHVQLEPQSISTCFQHFFNSSKVLIRSHLASLGPTRIQVSFFCGSHVHRSTPPWVCASRDPELRYHHLPPVQSLHLPSQSNSQISCLKTF